MSSIYNNKMTLKRKTNIPMLRFRFFLTLCCASPILAGTKSHLDLFHQPSTWGFWVFPLQMVVGQRWVSCIVRASPIVQSISAPYTIYIVRNRRKKDTRNSLIIFFERVRMGEASYRTGSHRCLGRKRNGASESSSHRCIVPWLRY